jgi:hypothetical protein
VPLVESELGAIVARANQIFRPVLKRDEGIDAQIRFRDDRRGTGRRLDLQLGSGDSHLRTRTKDGVDGFEIREPRWADYWQQQAYPVICTSNGVIRWMDVIAVLKEKIRRG